MDCFSALAQKYSLFLCCNEFKCIEIRRRWRTFLLQIAYVAASILGDYYWSQNLIKLQSAHWPWANSIHRAKEISKNAEKLGSLPLDQGNREVSIALRIKIHVVYVANNLVALLTWHNDGRLDTISRLHIAACAQSLSELMIKRSKFFDLL